MLTARYLIHLMISLGIKILVSMQVFSDLDLSLPETQCRSTGVFMIQLEHFMKVSRFHSPKILPHYKLVLVTHTQETAIQRQVFTSGIFSMGKVLEKLAGLIRITLRYGMQRYC